MGLDMSIYKIKRFESATLDDVRAVEEYISLKQYNALHPEKRYRMREWCGRDKPAEKFVLFYSKLASNDGNIIKEVAYWRKVNAVHRWFVKNVQDGEDDCRPHRELTRDDLLELRRLAQDVCDNPALAGKLLPTHVGFFFGGTDYDEWYLEGLKDTIKQIDNILETTDFDTEALYYQSSW